DRRVDGGREGLDGRDQLVGMRARMEKALHARGDEAADELGLLLEEIVVHDDAVADRDDAAVRVPEYARLLAAADLDRRHLALHEPGDRLHLAGDQRRWRAGRGDRHPANLVAGEL